MDSTRNTHFSVLREGSGLGIPLLSECLVDELTLLLPGGWSAPASTCSCGTPDLPLTLKTSTAFGNGVVELTYSWV